jgi:phosphoribosylformylglycinamidine (FGAM) synthase PurS component
MTIQVLVKLAAIDPWSFTVLDTLKRKFGCDEVTHVERVKCWELEFRPEAAERAAGITAGLLRDTVLLANPNRDRWVIRGFPGEGVPAGFWERSGDAAEAYIVKVTDKEDLAGQSLARILTSRLGISDIEVVSFSTIWVIEMKGEGRRSRDLAGEIAVARAWRKGFLANPHCQDAEVYPADEYFAAEVNRA